MLLLLEIQTSFGDASRAPNARCFSWLKAKICHSWDLPDASHNFHLTHNQLMVFNQLPAIICFLFEDLLPNQLLLEMQLLVKLKKMTDWHWRVESKCGEIERNGKLRRIDAANGI